MDKELIATSHQFSDLPMEDLISGPLEAATEANFKITHDLPHHLMQKVDYSLKCPECGLTTTVSMDALVSGTSMNCPNCGVVIHINNSQPTNSIESLESIYEEDTDKTDNE